MSRFDRNPVTGARLVSKAQERASTQARAVSRSPTVVPLTKLHQLAAQAMYGATAEIRNAARQQITPLLEQQRAAEAQRLAATQGQARSFDQSMQHELSGMTMTSAAEAHQQQMQTAERVQSQQSTAGGTVHSVTIERAYGPPEAAHFESSGWTSAYGGHTAVSVSRSPAQSPTAGRQFITTNVERRPDGTVAVTVEPK